ncbi:hypothetical protein ACP70R_007991 [Stipagrostis hirtigluma subsp. patula]
MCRLEGLCELQEHRDVFKWDLTQSGVLHRGTYWLRFWALLQRLEEDKDMIIKACQQLEVLAMQVFANYGWRFSNRIA